MENAKGEKVLANKVKRITEATLHEKNTVFFSFVFRNLSKFRSLL